MGWWQQGEEGTCIPSGACKCPCAIREFDSGERKDVAAGLGLGSVRPLNQGLHASLSTPLRELLSHCSENVPVPEIPKEKEEKKRPACQRRADLLKRQVDREVGYEL